MDIIVGQTKFYIKRRNDMKKYGLLLGAALMLAFTGCSKDEGESIIKNDDLDNMIEEATVTEETFDMESMSQDVEENYSSYKTTIKDEKLQVTVNVDAKVEIPTTDKLSVYGIKQEDINQDMLDKVRNALASDVTFYDGAILNIRTKADIEAEIAYYKDSLSTLGNNGRDYSPEEIEAEKVEIEYRISSLEEEYENAPDAVSFEDYKSDNMIHTIVEKKQEYPDSEYYDWQSKQTNLGDEVFYGISDGANGEYISLYVQNNTDYGNVIRYTKNTIGHNFASNLFVGDTASYELFQEGEESDFAMDNTVRIACTDKETLDLSIDKAKEEADALLNELGLSDFACSKEGKYFEIPDIRNTDELYYRPVYKFTYLRTVDNTIVSNEAGSKYIEGVYGDDYVKKAWCGESIVIMVNDTGIVGFYYNAPIEITETVVEESQLMTFEDVKGTFEETVAIAYGEYEYAYGDYVYNIDVTNVVLRYARISGPNDFDAGYLVPVWDFEGTIDIQDGEDLLEDNLSQSVLTINAIDGSVIDHTLGY